MLRARTGNGASPGKSVDARFTRRQAAAMVRPARGAFRRSTASGAENVVKAESGSVPDPLNLTQFILP